MSTDGTVALDWWFPTDDGKYVAYGTSANGSEESTLHVGGVSQSGKTLPDTIERTRFASVAWKQDDSGFLLFTTSKERRRTSRRRGLSLKDFLPRPRSDPTNDALIFGEGRKAQDIPAVAFGRWQMATHYRLSGWTKSEMYLQDSSRKSPPVEITPERNSSTAANV